MLLSIAGLSISLVGTVLVAFSVKKGDVQAWVKQSQKEYMAVFKPWMFYLGLGLLGTGFLLQICGVTKG